MGRFGHIPGLTVIACTLQSSAADECFCWAVDEIRSKLANAGWARVRLLDETKQGDLPALERALLALSRRLGFLVPQTYRGNVLAHIRNEAGDYSQHAVRGHQTNADLAFHSDRCDLNVLLYIAEAEQGGELSIVSYEDAAEALRRRDAKACDALFCGFPFDLREERIFPAQRWCERPILWHGASGIRGHYIRRFIADSQRHQDAPRLTDDQTRALDAFDTILAELRRDRTYAPRAGDLVALDNYRVMHARTGYVDGAGRGRLALRTWVAPFGSEPLPASLHPLVGSCEAGVFRGGVGTGADYHARLGKRSPDLGDARLVEQR